MEYIRRSNYDSLLSFRPDYHGFGSLTLIIRTELRRFDPTLGPNQYTARMSALGTEAGGFEDSHVRAWDDASFAEFSTRFIETIHECWNDRLSLVHPSGGRRHHRFSPTYGFPPALACRVRLVPVTHDPHMVLIAARPALISAPLRVYMCRVGGLGGEGGRTCGSSMGFLTQQAAREFSGRRDDADGLITAANVEKQSTTYLGVSFGQIAAVHELGHYLGLSHVNAANSPNDIGAEIAYGATVWQCSDVMGRGMRFDRWHTWPWLNRLARHIGQPLQPGLDGFTVAGWHGTHVRPDFELARCLA